MDIVARKQKILLLLIFVFLGIGIIINMTDEFSVAVFIGGIFIYIIDILPQEAEQ